MYVLFSYRNKGNLTHTITQTRYMRIQYKINIKEQNTELE